MVLEAHGLLQQMHRPVVIRFFRLQLLPVVVGEAVVADLYRLEVMAVQAAVLVTQQMPQAVELVIPRLHLHPKEQMAVIHQHLRLDTTAGVAVVQLLLVAMVLEVPLEMAALEQQTQLLAHP